MRLLKRLSPTIRPIDSRPVATLDGFTWSRLSAMARTVSTRSAVEGSVRPSRSRSWLTAIRTPAPAVKPTMTASETNRTSRPSRARPITMRSTPPMSASRLAAAR